MPSIYIDDFRYGMDRRRKRVAGRPGTLWLIKDGHITRGGDIERRKKFISQYTLPAGTQSAAALRGQLYTFGSADLAATMPSGVQYQRLQAVDTNAVMTRILDVKAFAGLLYVIAEYDDGNIYHFYDSARVSDWDNAVTADASRLAEALADKIAGNDAVDVQAFGTSITITAKTPGTAFTISGAAVDGGVDATEDLTVTNQVANVAAVAEVRATAAISVDGGTSDPGVNAMSDLTVNGTSILSAAVNWSGSDAATAIRITAEINNGSATHGYSASVSDVTITISAEPGTGATPNGYVIDAVVGGDLVIGGDIVFSGGVTAVVAVAQVELVEISGVVELEDTFSVTINGTTYKRTGLSAVMGTSLLVIKQRIFSPAGSLWRYCMLNTPTVWDPLNAIADNDAGYLNVASENGEDNLVGAARYQNAGAVFGANGITLYDLDVNPTNFAVSDTLENTGSVSPGSIIRYGNNDVFYLDTPGVRSVRARDASNAPAVSDVGNAIDTYIQAQIDSVTRQELIDAIAVIEPKDGRYMLALGDKIFVLTSFPNDKISGWSYYSTEEFGADTIEAFVVSGKKLYAKAGDAIYLYGGPDGDEYPDDDEITCEVHFPFLDGSTKAKFKSFNGFDVALTNQWSIDVLYDPNNEDRSYALGVIDAVTFNEMDMPLAGDSTMLAPVLVCSTAGAASLSFLALHYDEA